MTPRLDHSHRSHRLRQRHTGAAIRRAVIALGAALLVLTGQAGLAGGDASPARADNPPRTFTIGYSVQGRPLVVHRLGNGPVRRALIGAIHGAYEWNTAALMTRTLEYLLAHPHELPAEVTLFILPIANPDGYHAGRNTLKGRTNANGVDLNRNWDHDWRADAFFGRCPTSGGSAPFSEPETVAMRDFIIAARISEVIFCHSAYPAVFAGAGITQTETVALAQAMAKATGYPYRPEGIPGQIITGDATNWLTTNGVNAIIIELTNHRDIDWPQNLRGLRAFLRWKLED